MKIINVIGIGQGRKDLTSNHERLIKESDVIAGGSRHLKMFDLHGKEVLNIKGNLRELIDALKERMHHKKIVVLASGDPLFHGIGTILVKHIDPQYINILPNVTSVAAAFAMIKMSWHDAKIYSLHGMKKSSFSFSRISEEKKIAFLTDPHFDPAFIARNLIKNGMWDFRLCVLEQLGNPEKQEIIWFDNFERVQEQPFSQPNIVILIRKISGKERLSHKTHIGMPDNLYRHEKGMITKSEIRSIVLSKLKLIRRDHIMWDIGSGSGSVGIEASFQIPWGQVYSIEKSPERIPDIIHNIKNFNCPNVKVMNTIFPEGIDKMKPPDRIFIGGGGKALGKITDICCQKLSDFGIIVVNTVLIQNLEAALNAMQSYNIEPSVVQIQVSRSQKMPFGDRFKALNPIWTISGSKS